MHILSKDFQKQKQNFVRQLNRTGRMSSQSDCKKAG